LPDSSAARARGTLMVSVQRDNQDENRIASPEMFLKIIPLHH
jgi:hypothetical protein